MKESPRELLNRVRVRVDEGDYKDICAAKETRDETLKIRFAQIREGAPEDLKTVADIDNWTRRQPEWAKAVEEKGNKYADFMVSEVYLKLTFAEFDIWRSEEATNRGLDRRSGGS
jgi:hypothetical protein